MKQLPKEKAVELIEKMFLAQDETLRWLPDAKQCALIAVDISIEEIDNFNRHGGFQYRIDYLNEVKTEIQKL